MPISPLQPAALSSVPRLPLTFAPGPPEVSFDSVLSRRQGLYLDATARQQSSRGSTPEELARRTAQDFVAAALIEPILKQLRETSSAAPPFAPGPAEKQFRGIADAQVARQIAQVSRFAIVDQVARNLLRSASALPPSMPSTTDGNT